MKQFFAEWLESPDFKLFIESVHIAGTYLTDQESILEEIQEKLIQMGMRYNHLIFQVSENILSYLKKQEEKDIQKKLLSLLQQFEDYISEHYPKEMRFFKTYRERIKK